MFSEDGAGAVAVVDGMGSVALAEHAKRVVCGPAGGLVAPLRAALDEGVVNLGVATLLPRVAVVCGAHVVDLSEARRGGGDHRRRRGRARRRGRPGGGRRVVLDG